MQLYQIHNFKQDDLLTEDVYIIDVLSSIFIWVGQQVEAKTKTQKLAIGEVLFLLFTHILKLISISII